MSRFNRFNSRFNKEEEEEKEWSEVKNYNNNRYNKNYNNGYNKNYNNGYNKNYNNGYNKNYNNGYNKNYNNGYNKNYNNGYNKKYNNGHNKNYNNQNRINNYKPTWNKKIKKHDEIRRRYNSETDPMLEYIYPAEKIYIRFMIRDNILDRVTSYDTYKKFILSKPFKIDDRINEKENYDYTEESLMEGLYYLIYHSGKHETMYKILLEVFDKKEVLPSILNKSQIQLSRSIYSSLYHYEIENENKGNNEKVRKILELLHENGYNVLKQNQKNESGIATIMMWKEDQLYDLQYNEKSEEENKKLEEQIKKDGEIRYKYIFETFKEKTISRVITTIISVMDFEMTEKNINLMNLLKTLIILKPEVTMNLLVLEIYKFMNLHDKATITTLNNNTTYDRLNGIYNVIMETLNKIKILENVNRNNLKKLIKEQKDLRRNKKIRDEKIFDKGNYSKELTPFFEYYKEEIKNVNIEKLKNIFINNIIKTDKNDTNNIDNEKFEIIKKFLLCVLCNNNNKDLFDNISNKMMEEYKNTQDINTYAKSLYLFSEFYKGDKTIFYNIFKSMDTKQMESGLKNKIRFFIQDVEQGKKIVKQNQSMVVNIEIVEPKIKVSLLNEYKDLYEEYKQHGEIDEEMLEDIEYGIEEIKGFSKIEIGDKFLYELIIKSYKFNETDRVLLKKLLTVIEEKISKKIVKKSLNNIKNKYKESFDESIKQLDSIIKYIGDQL